MVTNEWEWKVIIVYIFLAIVYRCGHCMNLAPVWKRFGRDLKGWSQVVQVGAVNCADPQNTDLCHTYEIMSYPMLKFFWVNTR